MEYNNFAIVILMTGMLVNSQSKQNTCEYLDIDHDRMIDNKMCHCLIISPNVFYYILLCIGLNNHIRDYSCK